MTSALAGSYFEWDCKEYFTKAVRKAVCEISTYWYLGGYTKWYKPFWCLSIQVTLCLIAHFQTREMKNQQTGVIKIQICNIFVGQSYGIKIKKSHSMCLLCDKWKANR